MNKLFFNIWKKYHKIFRYGFLTFIFSKIRKNEKLKKFVLVNKKENFEKFQKIKENLIKLNKIEIINDKSFNLDKKYKDWFIELPKEFAYETWYLKDKEDINQLKIEEDILRHWSYELREILIKTRSYWYIKELIVLTNAVNWRWKFEENHFDDFDGKNMKIVSKILWKKLFKMNLKDILKEILTYWFPSEFSSQIYNWRWFNYFK